MMKMHNVTLALSLLASCAGSDSSKNPLPDAPGMQGGVDARKVTLPTWMLEDIQPQSPRVGQTYGLQTFSGKIVVVTLLEGF
ncbi:MAG: hypothetical protein M4D80_02540 [Myxococcota bacterium]|nr:hypothetical protein [Myxococcota bacterium]